MLNISKPLSSGQAQTHHKLEFTAETANYYKQDGAIQGQWQGQLAEKMGLRGAVTPEEFARLTEGRHPRTDEQMVQHREAQECRTRTARRQRRSSTGLGRMQLFPLRNPSR